MASRLGKIYHCNLFSNLDKNNKELSSIQAHEAKITALAISSDKKLLVSNS